MGFYPFFYYFITSQYPEVLLPTRTIKPSFLSSANRFLIVFSDKAKSSLNCLIVMLGFCMINSNVLCATFGQSLGNLWAIFMQILLLFLQSNHISTSFMHWNVHQEIASILICFNKCPRRTILGKLFLYRRNTRRVCKINCVTQYFSV